jgi:predicted transposase YbfD/YdcC
LPPPSPLRWTFPPYQQRLKAAQEETATEFNKGHGRKEQRTLTRTTLLNDYLDWPDIGQVFRLERKRTNGTLVTIETVYGITSLTTDQADAADLLNLVRTHWCIENQLHYVRDVTLGEDDCRVRKGTAPQILAALRNTAVHLLSSVVAASRAAATRYFAAHPRKAVNLVTAKEPEN